MARYLHRCSGSMCKSVEYLCADLPAGTQVFLGLPHSVGMYALDKGRVNVPDVLVEYSALMRRAACLHCNPLPELNE